MTVLPAESYLPQCVRYRDLRRLDACRASLNCVRSCLRWGVFLGVAGETRYRLGFTYAERLDASRSRSTARYVST